MTKSLINNTLYLVDSDPDHNKSILHQIVSKDHSAFANPTEICTKINKIPCDEIIHVVINTRGGSLPNCEKILRTLINHKGGYYAYIRYECYSAGSIIALGANKIIMSETSYIGKIDPQEVCNGNSTQLQILSSIDEKYITDRNIYQVINANRYIAYTEKLLDLIRVKHNSDYNKSIQELLYSDLPHLSLYDMKQCGDMELNVIRPFDDLSREYTNPTKPKNTSKSYYYSMVLILGFTIYQYSGIKKVFK